MEITDNMALIHPDTSEYPLYLRQVRKRIQVASLPARAELKHIRQFGFYPVMKTDKPKGDVVYEILPEKRDGVYHQTWRTRDFSEEERAQKLKDTKHALNQKANALRDQEILQGVRYEFPNGDTETIPLKIADQTILVTQRVLATEVMSQGLEKEFQYRTQENTIHSLTAQQMWQLTSYVLQYFESLMKNSWQYKDTVTETQTLEDLPGEPVTFRPGVYEEV